MEEEVIELEGILELRYMQPGPSFPTSRCVNSRFPDLRLSFLICKVRIIIRTTHYLMYLRIPCEM